MIIIVTVLIVIIVLLLVVLQSLVLWTKKKSLDGKHVLITGGSSGIGMAVGHEVAKLGAKVSIVARDQAKLTRAKAEIARTIENEKTNQSVEMFSVELGESEDSAARLIEDAEAVHGPVYMLVNCAGYSRAFRFEDTPPNVAKDMMNVNFFGSFFVSQAVIHSMKRNSSGGIIVLTSSLGGLFGIYGFSIYAATKGALIKMAEALSMEVKPYDIGITVCLPPDTDTPGFIEENKTKPVETKEICEVAGLFKPEDVARHLIQDALVGKFFSTVSIEGHMLTTLCAGMAPITDVFSFVMQVALSGIFRIISAVCLIKFHCVVWKEHRKRSAMKKLE